MNDFPDLNQYGYQIDAQLGCSREGGRITWKGRHIASQKAVVIKQFCFATVGSSWSGYKTYEREIEILQQLDCPGIPKYLDGIETKDGFCLIQEYIPACRLDRYRPMNIAEIKQLVGKLLKILVYLQQHNPPILHRDIKPENILIDDELNVYLIDFGFASLGSKEVSGSSVFKGTPGFIAPEQIVRPTLASDLYSLGVTIVCLLSNKNIAEIQNLAPADLPYQLNLKSLLPDFERDFLKWLEKMTDARLSKRFENAAIALEAFLSLNTVEPSGKSLLKQELPLGNLDKIKITVGISAIAGLSGSAVWGIDFVNRHLESSAIDLTIAIVAGIVIAIAQFSAIEIVKIDERAKLQGIILGSIAPVFLVGISTIIWGMSEAVDIAATIIVTQVLILSYFWWQIPIFRERYFKLKFSLLLAAIFIGTSLGLQSIGW